MVCPSTHLQPSGTWDSPRTPFIAATPQAASLSASTALPALAAQIAEATGKTKEVFGADKASKAQVEAWLGKVDAEQTGDLKVSCGRLASVRTRGVGAAEAAWLGRDR